MLKIQDYAFSLGLFLFEADYAKNYASILYQCLFVDRFLRKFRAAATVVIDESFTRHFCGSHNPLKSWRNSPRHSHGLVLDWMGIPL